MLLWTRCVHEFLLVYVPDPNMHDSLPEWSKGVDSSSTSASCVGSNPTAVRPSFMIMPMMAPMKAAGGLEIAKSPAKLRE